MCDNLTDLVSGTVSVSVSVLVLVLVWLDTHFPSCRTGTRGCRFAGSPEVRLVHAPRFAFHRDGGKGQDKWSLRLMNSGEGRVSYDKQGDGMREAEGRVSYDKVMGCARRSAS